MCKRAFTLIELLVAVPGVARNPFRIQAKTRASSSSFTLIELLVVIAIIAILAAMLLPALKGAKDMAKSALCMSNQKQVTTSLFLYSTDFNDLVSVHRWDSPPDYYWNRFLNGTMSTGGDYLTKKAVYGCPANKYYANDAESYSGWKSYAIYQARSDTDYATKGFRFKHEIINGAAWWSFHNLKLVDKPAGIILLADSISYRDVYLEHCYARFSPTTLIENLGGGGGGIHMTHRRIANVSFFDGHVEPLNSDGLFDTASNVKMIQY
ncbi:MAG TPA: hypothetical protein DCZ94_01400 [Lentisphaeria bacterium]|nr:hypothetical protein [Lentisphaeria bacterium]